MTTQLSAFLVRVQKQSTKLEFLLTLPRFIVPCGEQNKKHKSIYLFLQLCQVLPRQKRRENLSGKSARQSCAKYPQKKKNQILYLVLCLPQEMAFIFYFLFFEFWTIFSSEKRVRNFFFFFNFGFLSDCGWISLHKLKSKSTA